ncbi:Imm1 family immunity protein [Actinosynnema sp. NPDC000082]|uniref:Imm1 family immunity protein n=1 Tax=Actinosynnema sp. NPDC000082 TaxID=3363910 RepID=UPI0036A5B513
MTLHAIFDRETGDAPIVIRTQEDMSALVERVRAESASVPCPSIVEITDAEDPWCRPFAYAGIGVDRGFVQVHADPPLTTIGDPSATGVVVYDLQGEGTDIPADQEVPISAVRAVLSAYLAHDAALPEGFPGVRAAE